MQELRHPSQIQREVQIVLEAQRPLPPYSQNAGPCCSTSVRVALQKSEICVVVETPMCKQDSSPTFEPLVDLTFCLMPLHISVSPYLVQTRISHGQLSLDELHSRPSPRKIQAYDGARPGGGDVVRSPGDGDLSRSRRRHGGRFRPQSVVSSVSRSGVQEEIKWSGMWRDSRPDDVRSDTDFLGNDSQDLHATIGPPPPLPLPPLPMPSMAPLPIDGAGEGATKNRRELWPAKGSDTSSANDRSSKSSSRRKRRSMRRRGDSEGEPITGRGEENEGSTGSGSLYELRDALKARGKELLKLKRDVGAVATSAGSFKHLATSLANDSRGKMDSSKVAFRRDIDEGIDGRNQLGLSSASLYRDDDRPIGSEGGGVNAVVADGEVVPTVVWPEGDSARSPRKVTVEEHQHVPELFAKAVNGSASTRTEESEWPRRLKNISTSDAKKSLTTQEQSLSNPRQENALALVGGSPLVASAHAGLRKMRMVLEQRAVEAGRAKDVAGEMVSCRVVYSFEALQRWMKCHREEH